MSCYMCSTVWMSQGCFYSNYNDEGRNIFVMAVMEQTNSNQADYLALHCLGLASSAAFVLVNICCELSSMALAHHEDILCFSNIRSLTSGGSNDI